MPTSHRTNRLKLVSSPSVEKLQNGRFRLVFTAQPLNSRVSWYNANKSRIFADFGTLQDAEMSIDGIGARTGATYDNMRLVDVRTSSDGESYTVQFTYETISSTFVQVKDDTISFTESGLRKVQRESIAAAGTSFAQTVGTDSISHQINSETAVTCRLAAYEINDTDSSRTVIATYVEEGTLSRTEDFVGSQKAIIIEAIGPDPSTPSDYSLASKEESNFDGLQTNRFTFLKDGAILSRNTEQKQTGTSSSGKLKIQTVEVFNGTPASTIGGIKISEEKSNIGAIETTKAVFATGSGEVSRSTEKRNNGKLTITTVESLGSVGFATGVEIEATSREEDGYTIFRNAFANGQGEISRTVEKRNEGKLKITTIESLGSAGSATGVEIESTTREENGFTLFRNVFAQGTGEISRTTEQRNRGKLTITTVESLGSPGSATGLQIEESSQKQNGFTLFRNVFANGEGEISRTTEERNQGKLTITTVESLGSQIAGQGVQIEQTKRNEDGYTLFRTVSASGSGEISRNVQKRNQGKLTITTVESIGSKVTASGIEIEDSSREESGYTVFKSVTVSGSGEISRTSTNADSRLGRCKENTIISIGSAINPDGVLIRESEETRDGHTVFTRTSISGSITGTKTTYNDTAEVDVPGEVFLGTQSVSSAGETGTIATLRVKPKRKLKIKTSVKISVATSVPATGSIAYNLGEISCSVFSTNVQCSVGPGSTVTVGAGTNNTRSDTGFVKDFKVQSNISTFPGHFISGPTTQEGLIDYISSSQPVASGGAISRLEEKTQRKTELVGRGSTSATGWTTSGTISQRARPILTDLNGTVYFEIVTVTA